jgi:hypothetical protein
MRRKNGSERSVRHPPRERAAWQIGTNTDTRKISLARYGWAFRGAFRRLQMFPCPRRFAGGGGGVGFGGLSGGDSQVSPGIHGVAITGHGDQTHRDRVIAAGYADYLVKLVSFPLLKEILDAIEGGRKLAS